MSTESNTTYNGWTNYETWCVNLWIGNDSHTYNGACELARECKAEAADPELRNKYWSEAEHARFTLADRLKEEFCEGNPLADSASVWSDLLGAALSEVDWKEIADAFLAA